MKINTMRLLDDWLGRPLCLVATALEKARRLGDDVPVGRRLLVIKLSEQGAVVMLGEPFRRLREGYARENIWFLAFEESRPILKIMDLVPPENILTISCKSLGSFVASTFHALKKIWSLKVDAALDLEFFSRASALLAWLSGARRRTGVHSFFGAGPWRGELMTHPVKFNPHLHISQMFGALIEAALLPENTLQRLEFIPGPVAPVKECFEPTAEEEVLVEALVRECGGQPGETLVLLNANTSDRELIPLRRWDEQNYAELARQILARFGQARVLLTGGPGEAGAVAGLERAVGSGRCRSVAGRTTLRELMTLYRRSALMVTNDSGPAHFAALTGMPVVVLFGPETPQLWRPLGKEVRVICRGLACSPCFSIENGRRSGCRRNACMDMTPGEVMGAVTALLEQ
ncbi:MAG: glycosyltransferase family 9 protein [Chthoniobacteraceae bacterium]